MQCRSLTSLRVWRNTSALWCRGTGSLPSLVSSIPHRQSFWCQQARRKVHRTTVAALASSIYSLPGMAAQILVGRADAYEGFLVSPADLPSSPDEFDARIQHSLEVVACWYPSWITQQKNPVVIVKKIVSRIGSPVGRKAFGSIYL